MGQQLSRSLTSGGGTNRPPPHRQYVPEFLQDTKQANAAPRELPSSRDSGLSGGGQGHRIRDAILTSVCSIAVLFAGGGIYMHWYKANVLWKIEQAFSEGHDPSLALAKDAGGKRPPAESGDTEEGERGWNLAGPWTPHHRRKEQDLIERIVKGKEVGRYFMLLGPKGTGKTTMVIDAMQQIKSEGVTMCDAHPDPEVFRLRLGKALNYEYNEDSQTGLFQRRDPREGSSALDIERALNKLESVAINRAEAHKKPLVLIINNVHFFNHDDGGKSILLQLQQRAEAWAASRILTMVFSSDDSWPFFVMRQNATRMQDVSVYDISREESFSALKTMRKDAKCPPPSSETLEEVFNLVGGRLTYMSRITNAPDMLKDAKRLLATEKAWLLSQIGLIPDCDSAVVDEQKWSSCSWLLLQEFVKRRQEDAVRMKDQIARGEAKPEDLDNLPLPRIPYYEARQIMTRADFMDELDRKNIIAIDINHDLTPDSMLILHAAEEVCAEKDFKEPLEGVRRRVDKIQSSQHVRELTFKEFDQGDRVRHQVDKRRA